MSVNKSLFKNYIFNMVRTLTRLLFPLITFTYSARILGVDGVGQVNFAKSIISYFTLLAGLGMNYYGTREAAKLRDDREALSKFSHEMLMINMCTTVLAYILLFVFMAAVPKLHGYQSLLLVSSLAIVLQGLGMEWLYQGLEEYHYIAMRSVAFQGIALLLMFLFVRDANDVVMYAVVSLVASSGSYVMNFVNARRFISFRRCSRYEIKKHLRPILWLFAMAVSIELYTVLDSTMLGFLKGDTAVGKYTAAIKCNKLVNQLITAVGVVLIPRLSYYIGRKEIEKVNELIVQAYNYVFLLAVPAAVGIFMLSDEIIIMLSGKEFVSAGQTARILTPIVLVIPFSVLTNLHAFVPMGKEKLILLSTTVGAVTNFTCNYFLIPSYAENGAAVATVIAETAVTVICGVCASRYFDMKRVFRDFWQYWIAALPIPVIAIVFRHMVMHYMLQIFFTILLSVGSYFGLLCLEKNTYLLQALRLLLNRNKQ